MPITALIDETEPLERKRIRIGTRRPDERRSATRAITSWWLHAGTQLQRRRADRDRLDDSWQ